MFDFAIQVKGPALYHLGNCTDHHQTLPQCLSKVCNEPYFISECCPNYFCAFGHLEISDLDFATKMARKHSRI